MTPTVNVELTVDCFFPLTCLPVCQSTPFLWWRHCRHSSE